MKGFVYRLTTAMQQEKLIAGLGADIPKATWRTLRALVIADGGRELRDPDGALAVYPAKGQRLFEVYDRE